MHFITEMKRNIIHVWEYSSVSCLICLETVLNQCVTFWRKEMGAVHLLL